MIKYSKSVSNIKLGLKDRYQGEITKKSGIKYTPHEDFTFQNILVQRMIKHLFDFEMEYITYIIGIRRMD